MPREATTHGRLTRPGRRWRDKSLTNEEGHGDLARGIDISPDEELIDKARMALFWCDGPNGTLRALGCLPGGLQECMVQLRVTNCTRSRLNEAGALAWALNRPPILTLQMMVAHMFHAAALAGREAGIEIMAPPEGPLPLPEDFYALGFWQKLLGDWDSLPLHRPTHLELHTDTHVKDSRPRVAIRRLAVSMPLSWARHLLAGMPAYKPDLPSEDHRSLLPLFDTDFILAPNFPDGLGQRLKEQAADALRRFRAPTRR